MRTFSTSVDPGQAVVVPVELSVINAASAARDAGRAGKVFLSSLGAFASMPSDHDTEGRKIPLTDPTKTAATQQTGAYSKKLPRVLLVVWLALSVLLVLLDARSGRPIKYERSLADYAPVFVEPALDFPGYPLLPLDVVRNGLSGFMHFSKRNFLAAGAFYLMLLGIALYLAGAFAGEEMSGLLAALFVGATPFVLAVARVYDVHITRLAAIALVFAALGYFEKKRDAPALAVLVGTWVVGVFLCPATSDYLLYNVAIAGPAAVLLGWGAIRSPQRRLYWLAIGCWAAAAVIVTPGLLHYQGILNPTPTAAPQLGVSFSPGAVWSQPRIALAYPLAFFRAVVSVPLNWVLGVGIVLMFWRRDRQKWIWGAGLLLPLLVMILQPKRNMYYVANLLPAACLAAALGWRGIAARARGAGVVVFFVVAALLATAFSFGWLKPGRVDAPWSDVFVPGRRDYAMPYNTLSLEPFGSPGGPQDLFAKHLDSVLDQAPRPLAIGFIGKPCLQTILTLELLYRGIYARDVICSPAPTEDAAAYDAVVLLPNLMTIPDVAGGTDLAEIHRRLVSMLETDAPEAARLGAEVPLLRGETPTKANQELAERLRRATPVLRQLASTYSEAVPVGDFLFFIAPENEELKTLLQSVAAQPARSDLPPINP
ncbi:MAG: hypothetical protein P9L99_21390 [Candidatus Lernaella stagnicola]|nr:hypothetical protein [Candidatus Lernaella stagnicola]